MEINNSQEFRPTAVTTVSNKKTELDAVKNTVGEVPAQTVRESDEVEPSRVQPTEEIESVVSNLNEFAQSIRRDLAFNLQSDTGRVIVEVTDSQTGELIRKIPSEEALKIAERISEVRSLMTSIKA